MVAVTPVTSLFAHETGEAAVALDPLWILPLVLLGLLVTGGIVLVLVFRHARASRELLHDERMAAMKAGVDWRDHDVDAADGKFMHNAFWIAFWMVVVGGGAPFSAVSSNVEKMKSLDPSIQIVAWIGAAAAVIAAMTCATVLMVKSRGRVALAKQRPPTG